MPGEDGKLTPAERAHIQAEIDRRCPEFKCPCCRRDVFVLFEYVIRDELAATRAWIGERRTLPCVVIICQNCTHMVRFSAVSLLKDLPTASPQNAPGSEEKPVVN